MSIFERSLKAHLALSAVVAVLVYLASVWIAGDGVTLVGLGILLVVVVALTAWNTWAWRRRHDASRR